MLKERQHSSAFATNSALSCVQSTSLTKQPVVPQCAQNAAIWAAASGLPQLLEQPSQLWAPFEVRQAAVFERKAGHETKQSFL